MCCVHGPWEYQCLGRYVKIHSVSQIADTLCMFNLRVTQGLDRVQVMFHIGIVYIAIYLFSRLIVENPRH